MDGGLTEEKKVRLNGIRRRDERQQEEDMDAAIEVDFEASRETEMDECIYQIKPQSPIE